MRRTFSVAALVIGAMLFACGDDTENEIRQTASSLQEGAENIAGEVREAARSAWSSMRTDGERLIDDIRTGEDPAAQEELLNKCRDSLEKLREANSPDAGRVDQLCNRIREAEAQDGTAWADIKREIQEINPIQ